MKNIVLTAHLYTNIVNNMPQFPFDVIFSTVTSKLCEIHGCLPIRPHVRHTKKTTYILF